MIGGEWISRRSYGGQFKNLKKSSDLISRQAAIEWCRPEEWGTPDERWRPESEYGAMLEALPAAQPEQKWIPVKFRPMDSEEREYWEEHFEEIADEDAVMFDCPMPDDGQEILVSCRKWITMDKCEIDDGYYGLEGNGDWDGVIAWMPLPEPYTEEDPAEIIDVTEV